MSNIITRTLAATIVAAGLAAAVGTTTANASVSEFEQQVQSEMPYVVAQYGMPAVRKAGYDICSWEAQGYTDTSGLADSTIHYLPMSRTAAIQLQVFAEFYLGC